MRRFLASAVLVLAVVASASPAAAAEPVYDTTGPELASSRSGLDGAIVRFEGEVVSEPLFGGQGHVWVNVLSEGTAIGVWMPGEMAAEIEVLGQYSHTGDIVRVTGRLSEACDEHGGDLDVHAESLELLERGQRREHTVERWKLGVGLVGLGVAYAGWWRMRRKDEGAEW
ncbi:MAG: hypothetical protein JXP72_03245 [Coriobacteriia bacterium]|nr:hypothetical protein [Coriobacteriia bacterium]